MEQLKYDKINMEDNEFKKDSLEKMKKMLTINRDGNIIYICHPNHLLNDFEINENKEITNVHYGDFSVERMFEVDDFGAFSIIEQLRDYSQFSYLNKRAKHMMKKYKEENKMNFKYPLVVLEETLEGNFHIRGIISCGQEGYSVTFNPNFNPQYEHECIFTKALKYGKN